MPNILNSDTNTGIPIQPSQDGLYEVKNDTKTGVENTLETRESCKYKTVKTRVYFVRHGSTNEDEHNKQENLHIPQTPQASLSGKGHEEMYKVGKELVEMGLTKENTLFLYSDDTLRAKESLDVILDCFQIGGVENNHGLKTSQKNIDPKTGQAKYFKNIQRLQVDLLVIQQTIALMEDLIANVDYHKYRHIVLLGHKSNQPGITESVTNKDRGFDGGIDIPNGGVIEVDIPEGIDDYVDHAREKDLFINSGNYVAIRDTIKGVITIDTQDVIDFQNKLNVHFINHPELFQTYAFYENDDLRWFCIYNLIKLGDLQTLNNVFKDVGFRNAIHLKQYKHLNTQEYEVLQYYKHVYPQVLEMRAKSLDARIRNDENIDAHFGFKNTTYDANLLALIVSGKEIKYIEAKAGAGKSFLLVQLAEKLHAKNMEQESTTFYHPYYINLSGKGLEAFSGFPSVDTKASIVYLIDSIDESNIHGSERKELDEKLLELSKTGKVIITSRNGYRVSYPQAERKMSEEISEAQEIVELLDFDSAQIDTYLEGYFSQDTGKIPQAKEILSKLNGAGNNPLLLCMVCEVVKAGGIKDEDGNILSLEGISIIKIYENIVRLRLIDYNIHVQKRDVSTGGDTKKDRILAFKYNTSILCKIGYFQLFEGKELDVYGLKELIFNPYMNFEILNLIFRKSESENLDFVHQSFKEYFASKYVFEEMKNNKNFDFEDFLCQKLKKVDINFLEMLCEFLQNDEGKSQLLIQRIFEFAEKNNVIHKANTTFLVIKLGKDRLEKYLQYVKISLEVFETLVKYGGALGLDLALKGFYSLDEKKIMSQTGDKELLHHLKNINRDVNLKKIEVLTKYGGKKGIDFIVREFTNIDKDARQESDMISLIFEFGGEIGEKYIVKNFDNFTVFGKNRAIIDIGKYGGNESVQFLLDKFMTLENGQKLAIKVIGKKGGIKGIKLLIEYFCYLDTFDELTVESFYQEEMMLLIESLMEYGGEDGKEFLLKRYDTFNNNLKIGYLIGIGNISGSDYDEIIKKEITNSEFAKELFRAVSFNKHIKNYHYFIEKYKHLFETTS